MPVSPYSCNYDYTACELGQLPTTSGRPPPSNLLPPGQTRHRVLLEVISTPNSTRSCSMSEFRLLAAGVIGDTGQTRTDQAPLVSIRPPRTSRTRCRPKV